MNRCTLWNSDFRFKISYSKYYWVWRFKEIGAKKVFYFKRCIYGHNVNTKLSILVPLSIFVHFTLPISKFTNVIHTPLIRDFNLANFMESSYTSIQSERIPPASFSQRSESAKFTRSRKSTTSWSSRTTPTISSIFSKVNQSPCSRWTPTAESSDSTPSVKSWAQASDWVPSPVRSRSLKNSDYASRIRRCIPRLWRRWVDILLPIRSLSHFLSSYWLWFCLSIYDNIPNRN